ncbi:MAG: ribose ABC transporter permease [Flexilinea sp.]
MELINSMMSKSKIYINLSRIIDSTKNVLALVVLCVLLSILTPKFFTESNILNVLRQTSINAIMAIGVSFVILTGGIDLSVGSVLAFSAAIAAGQIKQDVNFIVAIIAGLIVGAIIGGISGIIVAKIKVAPFITTLAMMTIGRGATRVYTTGKPITGLGDSFAKIGAGYIGDLPIPVLITLIVFLIAWYIQNQTRFGRYVYAIGGNEEATRLSGVNVDRIKISVYAISGMMAALSGLIISARLDSAQPVAGDGAELDAIAAVVIGGVSLSGGKGSALGVLIGALIIGVLNNGQNLLNVSPFYQQIVKGLVILIAVIIDSYTKKSKNDD